METPEWKTVFKSSYRGRESLEKFMAIVDSAVFLKFKKLYGMEEIAVGEASIDSLEKAARKIMREKKIPKHLKPLLYRALLEKLLGVKLGLSPKEIKNIIIKG